VQTRTSNDVPEASPRRLGWWVRDSHGRLTLALWPNPAIGVWLVARVLAWTDLTSLPHATIASIGTGALLVWALDEVLRGTSPFRGVLGAVVLAVQLVGLFR
jgi:hypothetical protein